MIDLEIENTNYIVTFSPESFKEAIRLLLEDFICHCTDDNLDNRFYEEGDVELNNFIEMCNLPSNFIYFDNYHKYLKIGDIKPQDTPLILENIMSLKEELWPQVNWRFKVTFTY